MIKTDSEISEQLSHRGVRPSVQRMQIYRFMDENRIHPTVDEIYLNIHKIMPPLSRMTVYNTVKLFEDKGIVQPIIIEDTETRYDINIDFHGHFKCTACGQVSDLFNVAQEPLPAELKGCTIRQKHLYYIGTCKSCSQKNNNQ